MSALPPSSAVADVLQLRGKAGWLSPPLRRMTETPPTLGKARTVRLAAGPGGLSSLHALLAEDLDGRIIVVAGAAAAAGAVWGEILTLAARARGALGVLIDGAVRDIAALDLPVWARSEATAGPGPGVHVAEIGGPVTIGTASLTDGDPVLMDQEGVVVLSQEILDAAAEYARAEDEVVKALRAGQLLAEAYRHKATAVARLR